MEDYKEDDFSPTTMAWFYMSAGTLNEYIDDYNNLIDYSIDCREERVQEMLKCISSFHEQGKQMIEDLKKYLKEG